MITTREMRVLEMNTVALGIPLLNLMEAAGKSVADYIYSKISPERGVEVTVLAGKGGNGGDGFVAARYLSEMGYRVQVILSHSPSEIEHPDAARNFQVLKKMTSVRIRSADEEGLVLQESDVIVDALLGTGVKGELRGTVRRLVEEANKTPFKLKVAVDTPTGLNPDTGEIHGVAFKADVTITFHDIKPGLLKRPEYTGEIVVAKIGIPLEASLYVGPGDVAYRLPPRPPTAHKGSSGRVLAIAGSEKYVGAAYLAAKAALLAGVDLSFLLVPKSIRSIVAGLSPDIITIPYDGEYLSPIHVDVVEKTIDEIKPHVVAIGPGLGSRSETIEAVKGIIRKVLERDLPMVIDADALKAVKEMNETLRYKAVLTPHRGEFRYLTGVDLGENPLEKASLVKEYARRKESIILLKAPIDIISDGTRIRFNKTGNPYMAVGGTGDILTGLVAGFIARSRDLFDAACVAAYVNGVAGDYMLRNQGYVVASEMLNYVPLVLSKPLELHTYLYG